MAPPFVRILHKGGLNFHNLVLIDVAQSAGQFFHWLRSGALHVEEADLMSRSSGRGRPRCVRKATFAEAVLADPRCGDVATWHAKGEQIARTFGLRRKERSREIL